MERQDVYLLMVTRVRHAAWCTAVVLLTATAGWAQDPLPVLPAFTPDDRVLILAPHPDDESIATGGVIQRATAAGAQVKVVFFTNGDNNELAFIVYEKRLTFLPGEFIHMGKVRGAEGIAALARLGVRSDQIVFLGYPDFGTTEILLQYWGATKPYRSLFPRTTRVGYPEAMSPGAPYVGESILKDLRALLGDFKPTKIFVSHPADTNRDHRALYVFLRVALWDLEAAIPAPQVFPYPVHVVRWPMPRGYHPALPLLPPQDWPTHEIAWMTLPLNDDEVKAKHDAIAKYRSQIEVNPPYLFTFARANELFGDYKTIRAADAVAQPMGGALTMPHIASVAYAVEGKDLVVNVVLRRRLAVDFGMHVYLLGYSPRVNFAQMPKITIAIGLTGTRLHDKKKLLEARRVRIERDGKHVTCRVPLQLLGDPSYVLSCVRARSTDMPAYESAWRIVAVQ